MGECVEQVIVPKWLRWQNVLLVIGKSQVRFLARSHFHIISITNSAFDFTFSDNYVFRNIIAEFSLWKLQHLTDINTNFEWNSKSNTFSLASITNYRINFNTLQTGLENTHFLTSITPPTGVIFKFWVIYFLELCTTLVLIQSITVLQIQKHRSSIYRVNNLL